MTNLREAAQQALEALQRIETVTNADWLLASKAVRDLNAALAEPECPHCSPRPFNPNPESPLHGY